MSFRVLAAIAALAFCSTLAQAEGRPPLVLDATATTGIDIERLRAAIAHETGRTVVLQDPSSPQDGERVVVTTSEGRLRVALESRHLERDVALESGEGPQVRQIALLVGNLTINQAEEFTTKSAPPQKPKPLVIEPTPAPPAPKKKERIKWVLSASPLQAWGNTVEIGAEARASRRVGLGGTLGVGYLKGKHTDCFLSCLTKEGNYLDITLGFSPRYYFVGDFDHGLQIGLLTKASIGFHGSFMFDNAMPMTVSIGSYLGYKYTAPFGLTVEVQGGIAAAAGLGYPDLASHFGIAASLKAVDISSTNADKVQTGYGAILNANIGWTF